MKKSRSLIFVFYLFYEIGYSAPPTPNSQNASIDGGIILLGAAGLTYAIYQLHKRKQEL